MEMSGFASAAVASALAAICATDAGDAEEPGGAVERGFTSVDEWAGFAERVENGQARASCVVDFPFADACGPRGLKLQDDARLLERMYCFHDPDSVEARLYNFVQWAVQKLEAQFDEGAEGTYPELVVWVRGFRDQLITIGDACSGVLKGGMANTFIPVWDLKNNQPGERLRAGGVAAVRKALQDLLAGPLASVAPRKLVVMHVHTLMPWGERMRWPATERLREVTSVNLRHAARGAGGAWEQEQKKFYLVPQDRSLNQDWQTLFKNGKKEEIVWNPYDDNSVPRGDHCASWQRYKDVRDVIKAGDALCGDAALAFVTANLNQTQAVMRGGDDVEYEVVGVASMADLFEAGEAGGETAQSGVPAAPGRKKVLDGGADADFVDWKDEPPWKDLPTPSPLQAGQHCILFVGANNSEESKLSVEREATEIEEAFTCVYGSDAWRDKMVFRFFFFGDMQALVDALLKYKPVGVHFVCHGHKSALSLYKDEASVQVLTQALAPWSSSGDSALRFVVANACHSAHLATALSEHVDFVIGHSQPVQDEAAVKFAVTLYKCLGSEKSLFDSFNLATAIKGCSMYCLRGRKNAHEFYFPRPLAVSAQRQPHEVGVGQVDVGHFTRRVELMERLSTWAATDAPRIAVVGQGGSGKSTLARCWLKEISLRKTSQTHGHIRLVFFLEGGALMQGYRQVLQELQRMLQQDDSVLHVSDVPDKDEEVRALVHKLLQHSDVRGTWVAVLDDLPSPTQLDGLQWLLEPNGGEFPWGCGRTVVTSRFRAWTERLQHGLDVGVFEVQEAHDLLMNKVERWRVDEDGVASVARRLGHFPLALTSAAGCADKYELSPAEYLAELDHSNSTGSQVLEAWSCRPKTCDEYPYELFEVVHATWQRLAEGKQALAVMALLRKLAFMDTCNIPLQVFADLRLHLPVLKEHCLVSVTPAASAAPAASPLVAIHALTQQVIREHLMGNSKAQVLADVTAALQAQMDTFDKDKPETYKTCTCRAYTAHVKAVLAHTAHMRLMQDTGASDAAVDASDASMTSVEGLQKDMARLAHTTGLFCATVTSAFADALDYYQKALKVFLAVHGQESMSVASTYGNMANVYSSQGHYERALEYYQKTLDITIKVVGHDHCMSVASAYNGIANVYYRQGHYERALEYHQKTLDITIQVVGHDHIDLAKTYTNIGHVYNSQGHYERALEYHQKSLDIEIKVVGHDHDVAKTRENMATIYYQQGLYDQALEVYKSVLDTKIQVVGHDCIDVAKTYMGMANVYYSQGHYERALEYYQNSLDIKIKVVGHDRRDVADTYMNMGNVYCCQGHYERALEYYQKSLDITIKVVGHDHIIDVAKTRENMASIYFQQGLYDQALEVYKSVLDTKVQVVGHDCIDVAGTYMNIGSVYDRQGHYERALEYHQKSLDIKIQVVGHDHHIGVADSYRNIGVMFYRQGKKPQAIEMATKAYDISLKLLGSDHPRTKQLASMIGK